MSNQQPNQYNDLVSDKGEVVEKIADLLEERKGERRHQHDAPEYLNEDLDRRKSDRRTEV